MTSELVLFAEARTTLADRLAAAAQARTLVAIVKDAQKRADRQLKDEVERLSSETGTAFTARGDGDLAGWSALITAPVPKPYVTDEQTFAAWWAAQGLEHQERTRVEVLDHEAAAKALDRIDVAFDGADDLDDTEVAEAGLALAEALRWQVETVLPSGAADKAAEGATPVESGYVTAEGELIPGLGWRTAKPELRVNGNKDAKTAARRRVCELLGIDEAALEDGGAT